MRAHITVRALAALSPLSLVLASCIALVEEPITVVACDADDDCEAGSECGLRGAMVQKDGVDVHLCVPEGCSAGASCGADCACACEGCAEDELCDVDHSESNGRTDGKACVPAACFDAAAETFACGTVTSDGASVTCLPCASP